MNPFDILSIIILAFCCIRGLFRGLVKEMASIIGVLGGFYAAYTYYPMLAGSISDWISDPAYRNIAGFVILFSAIFIIISLLGLLINFLLKITFLSWFDRLSGAAFGMLKGFLIVSVLMIAFTAFLPSRSPMIRNSTLSPHISAISEEMARFVSSRMKQEFTVNLKGLKKFWEQRN